MSIATSRTLSPLAVDWLLMLPPGLRVDPWVQGIFNALALEMERLIDQALTVGEGLNPMTANAETLPMWEALLGLPINPPNTSVAIRQDLVASRMLRGDGSGAQWEQQMRAATKNSLRYTENDSGDPSAPRYTLAIDTALPQGVTIEALRTYTRSITPANLHINLGGGQTYAQAKALHATYLVARNSYLNYDNMRYGTV